MMFSDGYEYHETSFEQMYRCHPPSFINKPQMENGDKIIMPPSALDRLVSLHIDYPMLFELCDAAGGRVSHCGVLEFIAEEGIICIPYWMMENMKVEEGDILLVRNVTLPKGTYVKLQPHTMDFLDISNPKAILETSLRRFSCLTVGDSIMVAYNNKKYYIDIVEAKPFYAVSIIETDCEVEFARPLDYKEPERPMVPEPSRKRAAAAEGTEDPTAKEPRFNPFSGVGRRLDGKAWSGEAASGGQKENGGRQSGEAASGGQKENGGCQSGEAAFGGQKENGGRQSRGKLVFGSGAAPREPQKKEAQGEGGKKEESEFKAFTGKNYSLQGGKKEESEFKAFTGKNYLLQGGKKEESEFKAFTGKNYSLQG